MKEIVIKIPDKVYDYVRREWVESDFDSPLNHVMNGVKNGTELPKGHGELIDARAFLQSISSNDYDTYTDYSNTHAWITDADVLVEEDRGKE